MLHVKIFILCACLNRMLIKKQKTLTLCRYSMLVSYSVAFFYSSFNVAEFHSFFFLFIKVGCSLSSNYFTSNELFTFHHVHQGNHAVCQRILLKDILPTCPISIATVQAISTTWQWIRCRVLCSCQTPTPGRSTVSAL